MAFRARRAGDQYDGAKEQFGVRGASAAATSTPRREFAVRHESIASSGRSDLVFAEQRVSHMSTRLQAYREDLAHWFSVLFKDVGTINVDNFFEHIETGVLLCRLALLVDSAEEENGYSVQNRAPIKYNLKAQKGHFFSRDNVACFIAWARSLGVESSLLFETDDLVERKNEKHVLYCLMEIGRLQHGVPPPKLVELERLLDAGHAPSEEDEEKAITMIEELIIQNNMQHEVTIQQLRGGVYKINDLGPYNICLLRRYLMIRVGKIWDTFEHFLVAGPLRTAKAGNGAAQTADRSPQPQVQTPTRFSLKETTPGHKPLTMQEREERLSALEQAAQKSSPLLRSPGSRTANITTTANRLSTTSMSSALNMSATSARGHAECQIKCQQEKEQLKTLYEGRLETIQHQLAEAEKQTQRLLDRQSFLADSEREAIEQQVRAACNVELNEVQLRVAELEEALELERQQSQQASEQKAVEYQSSLHACNVRIAELLDDLAQNDLTAELDQVKKSLQMAEELNKNMEARHATDLKDIEARHKSELLTQTEEADLRLKAAAKQALQRFSHEEAEMLASQKEMRDDLEAKIRAAEQRAAAAEQRAAAGEQRLHDLETQAIQAEAVRRELAECKPKMDAQNKELMRLRSLLAQLESDHQQCTLTIQQLELENTDLKTTVQHLENTIGTLQADLAQAKDAQETQSRELNLTNTQALADKEQELQAALAQLSQLEQLQAQLQQAQTALAQQERALETTTADYEQKLEQAEQRCSTEKGQMNEEFQQQLLGLQADNKAALDAERAEHAAKCREYEEHIAGLEQRIKELEDELAALGVQVQQTTYQTQAAADARLKELELELAARHQSELDRLKELEREQREAEEQKRLDAEIQQRELAERALQAEQALRSMEEAKERERQEEEERLRQAAAEEAARLQREAEEADRLAEEARQKAEQDRILRERQEQEAILQAKEEEEERAQSDAVRQELEELLPMRTDIAEWINGVLGTELTPETLLKELANGEVLCSLAGRIDAAEDECRAAEAAGRPLDDEGFDQSDDTAHGADARASEAADKKGTPKSTPKMQPKNARTSTGGAAPPTKRKVKPLGWRYVPPQGVSVLKDYIRGRTLKPPKFTPSCPRGSNAARENVQNFITWARGLGLASPDVFGVDDCVRVNYNPRRIIYGLYDVAYRTRRFPIPRLVWMMRRKHYRYDAAQDDPLDQAVQQLLEQCVCRPPMTCVRDGPGRYKYGSGTDKNSFTVKESGKNVVVRVGGGWESFRTFLATHDKCRTDDHMQRAKQQFAVLQENKATHPKTDAHGQPIGFLTTRLE
eukprot:m.173372 g.173372  ORF g.173372 m.173372 type:complete len:1318 (+) comp21301_c0_seq1:96-4049(+)